MRQHRLTHGHRRNQIDGDISVEQQSPEHADGVVSRRGMLRLGAVGAVIGGGMLTACTDGGTSADPSAGSDQGGEASEAPEPKTPAQLAREAVAALPTHDDLVGDLTALDLSGATGAQITLQHSAALTALSTALDVAVTKTLRESSLREEEPPQIASRIFAAGPELVGSMLDVTDGEGTWAATLWHLCDEDCVVTSPALIDASAWSDFTEQVRTALGEVEGADTDKTVEQMAEQPRPWGNGPAIIPTAEGSAQVLFPSAPLADAPGELLVEIPAEQMTKLWSSIGQRAVDAVASPEAVDLEAASAAHRPVKRSARSQLEVGGDSSAAPRQSEGPGPRTQLAPLAEEGKPPSAVAAPDASALRTVALTFDDGPAGDLNTVLREHLAKHGAAATFFMIGQSAEADPDTVRKTATAGHEIGGHSWSHPDLTRVSDEKLASQFDRTAEILTELTGRAPLLMRPPYGAVNKRVEQAASDRQEGVQLWSVDSLDWKLRDVQKNLDTITSTCSRGSVVLMHEIHQASVDTVPQLLEWFTSGEYTLVTCSEMDMNRLMPAEPEGDQQGQDGASASDGGGETAQ